MSTSRSAPPRATQLGTAAAAGAPPLIDGQERRTNVVVWAAVTAVTLGVFLARTSHVFHVKMYADGDFASNGILMNRALQWRLLIGHYSRVGFHHPGPALLYIQAWSQWLFHDVLGMVPAAYNAHLLGVLILNAVLIGGTAQIFYAHTRSVPIAIAGIAAILLFVGHEQMLLTSTIMPDVVFTPFLVYVSALSSVLAGRWASLPWVALGAGLAVHGHVAFIGFVGPAVVLLIAVLLVRHRREVLDERRRHRRPLLTALAIAGVFALPIIVNTVLQWPGEFGRYREYVRLGHAGGHSFRAVVHYTLLFWSAGAQRKLLLVALILGATALAVTDPDPHRRRFLLAVLVNAGLMSLLFLNYGLRGIDDLGERYIGIFYLAVPALVTAIIAMSVAGRLLALPWSASRWTAVAVIGAAVVAWPRYSSLGNSYRGEPRAPVLAKLLADTPRRAGRPVLLSFPTETWPLATAVIYHASQGPVRICSDPVWSLIESPQYTCSDEERRTAWHVFITPHDQVGGPTVWSDPGAVMFEVPKG